ncbi:hypothetical protein TRIP_C21250 [Candidatus Zixiibacteriota bacterium]|nr:hypothetical protein TRIP_C21250 [candidate division Zixibacteria bacterium]
MQVLVAAEKILNDYFTDVLDDIGIDVITIEPALKKDAVLNALRKENFDLIILTNSDFPPGELPPLSALIKLNYPRAKIIVVTGYIGKDLANSLAVIGIDAFMTLPFKIAEMQAVVRRILGIESDVSPSIYQS